MATRRPNILWYCADQQRYDTIGALNNSHVSTPLIDRWLSSGTAFTKAYCQSPICTPSRASFLTGRYPNALRAPRNGNAVYADCYPLITRVLRDAGYECGLVGKLHLASAFQRREPRVDDGYTYFKWSHAPRDDWPAEQGHDYAEWVREQGADLGALVKSLDGVPAPLHQTTWATSRAIEFIDQVDHRPWCLSINIYDPHPPFNPPAAYRQLFEPSAMPDPWFRESDIAQQKALAALDFQSQVRHPDALDIGDPILPRTPHAGGYRAAEYSPGARDAWTLKAAYYAMIKLIDDQFGRLIAALDQRGLLADTVVIYTSDHGETLGDHGLIEKGCRFYEGLVRVPLIISCPGRIAANQQTDALVELIDIVPTLLDLLGLEHPEFIQGRSLWPILTGAADPAQHKPFVRSEYFDAIAGSDRSRATMYRDARYKLIVYHGHDLGELYDLQTDPCEFDNLWANTDARECRDALVRKSFDATMLAEDLGPPRLGPM